MREYETIAAISTSIGESGVSIIKISGSDAKQITGKIFKQKNGKSFLEAKTFRMHYGHIVAVGSQEPIDEVLVSFFSGPKSFTAEDVVEINCHGGIVSTESVLN